jgi:sialic acid synthase SpsE
MYKKFKIQNLKIGYNFNPIIIAEIGINHGGSLKIAKKMAKLAINSGAHIIKHQTHIVDDEMSSEAKKNKIKYIGKSIYNLMKECALNEKEEYELKLYVEKLGSIFLSTPFSRAAVDRLVRFKVPAFKIGSGECNNYPLIEYICSFEKPIILSTGMNTIKDIKRSVNIIEKHKIPYALLHTTNIYPTPYNLIRLGAIEDLKKEFKNAVIGLSDHSKSNLACLGAIAMGASIVERHFTDTLLRKGPDISNSMDPRALKELSRDAKIMKLMRGGGKKIIKEEQVVKNFAFASVVTIANIKKGEKFSKENIWVKRPGGGDFLARDYSKILNKRAKKSISSNKQLRRADIF